MAKIIHKKTGFGAKAIMALAGYLAFTAQGTVLAGPVAPPVSLPSPITYGGHPATLEGIIGNVMGFIFWLGIVICPILIVWGGFSIATAGDDQNKVSQGKQIITYAIVGLLIIAVSNVMVYAIQNILK